MSLASRRVSPYVEQRADLRGLPPFPMRLSLRDQQSLTAALGTQGRHKHGLRGVRMSKWQEDRDRSLAVEAGLFLMTQKSGEVDVSAPSLSHPGLCPPTAPATAPSVGPGDVSRGGEVSCREESKASMSSQMSHPMTATFLILHKPKEVIPGEGNSGPPPHSMSQPSWPIFRPFL